MHAAFATPQLQPWLTVHMQPRGSNLGCASSLRKGWGIPGMTYDPGRMDKIGFAACQHPQDMCFHGAVGFSHPLPHKVLFDMLATRIA